MPNDFYDRYYKTNPYLIAIYNGHLDILKILEENYNYDPTTIKDEQGNNVYLFAVKHGKLDILQYLEKKYYHVKPKQLNIFQVNAYGLDAYLLAAQHGRLQIMKYLEKEHKWDIHVKSNYKGDYTTYDAYYLASKHFRYDVINYLKTNHKWDKISDSTGYHNNKYHGGY